MKVAPGDRASLAPVVQLGVAEPDATVPPFELLPSKTAAPRIRRGSVRRTKLLETLRASRGSPMVAVVASAGYGKTTLLAQWAARDRRPFAWVTLDEHDNDPVVLLTYIAAALGRVEHVEPAVFDSLASPGAAIDQVVVPLLASSIASIRKPFVLVLDNIDAMTEPVCIEAVSRLAENVPPRSQIAVAGRSELALPFARMRASEGLVEIGQHALAMDDDEMGELLDGYGVDLPRHELDAITQRTEGWPVGLYLAALAIGADEHPEPAIRFHGDDRFIADYLWSEVFSQLTSRERRFLAESSVLDTMNGPLCDAALQRSGSDKRLRSIQRRNSLVVPLDHHGDWYRYHELFRDFLRKQLQEGHPELATDIRLRASDWYRANGMPEQAVEYALAAGDADRVADLVAALALPVGYSGRVATVARWLEWLDRAGVAQRHAPAAVLGAWINAVEGRALEAERWADAAGRGSSWTAPLPDGTTTVVAWTTLLDAALCRSGPERMGADAAQSLSTLATESLWRPTAHLMLGLAHLMTGHIAVADADFADAAESAERIEAWGNVAIALAERALIAMDAGDWSGGTSLAVRARTLIRAARQEGLATSAVVFVAAMRAAVHGGEPVTEDLKTAERLSARTTHALPYFAVQVKNELARSLIALGDVDGAAAMLRQVKDVRDRRPDLGTLYPETDDLWTRIETMRSTAHAGPKLTAAEQRLLPQLSTHHTFREIGDQLYLSPNTVKTQAISVYRKLGVASRGEAVARARALGLLD